MLIAAELYMIFTTSEYLGALNPLMIREYIGPSKI